MEDLASAIDQQNAEDLLRPPALDTPEPRQEQPIEVAPASEEHAQSPGPCVLPVEDSGHNNNDAGIPQMSLEDVIRRRIPDDSELGRSIRQRCSFFSAVSHDGTQIPGDPRYFDLDVVRSELQRKGSLIIEDINVDCGKTLCAAYPGVLHPEIMAEHIVRFDEISAVPGIEAEVVRSLESCYPDAEFKAEILGDSMTVQTGGVDRQRTLRTAAYTSNSPSRIIATQHISHNSVSPGIPLIVGVIPSSKMG